MQIQQPDKQNLVATHKTYDFLFQCEHVMIKEFVQFLVGIVDAQLLERVDGKVLKPENI